MNTTKRLLLFSLIIFSQSIYLPLNRFLQGGTTINIALDEKIPVIAAWSIPYLLWMFCWFWLCLWAALKMPPDLFKTFSSATMLVVLSAMVVYLLFPTYVERNPVETSGFGAGLLHWIYSNDGLYNAFPSGHIYLATLTAIFYSRWYPRSTLTWIFVLIVISLSTLFTGQHYILDVLGGALFAFAGTIIAFKLRQPPGFFKNHFNKNKATF